MNPKPNTKLEVRNAFDGDLIESFDYMSKEIAEAALKRAHQLHEDRNGWLSAVSRISILNSLAELVSSRRESLAKQSAREGGKPLKDSLIEIDRAVEGIKVAVAEIGQLHGKEVPMGLTVSSEQRFAHTFREPRGVVLAISAFNHPFNLIIHQVVTAIASGCPVLVKPALATPISCKNIVDMLTEAGLPAGWCQLLICDRKITESLVADSRIAFLTFIGSARVGWYLRSRLAPGAACSLEHGGVAPVIVDASADIDDAIVLLTRGAFYHAGQVCVSVQRIYVHRSIVDQFTKKLLTAAAALKTGDPLDINTDVGPLIKSSEVERVDSWVQEAVAGGAKLLCGGKKLSDTTYEPTVLFAPSDEARVSREEVFGPLVSIYPYDEIDHAVARANALDLFFQASIFTKDLDRALTVSRRLKGMAVMVNDHSAFRVDWMPFGGHRQSGLGLGGIGHTMRDMTLERMIVFRSPNL